MKVSKKLIPQKNKRLTAIVIDANTGLPLYEENAYALRCPASTIKLLVAYIVFSELKRGKLHFTDQLKISQHAAQQKPSKLGLKAGNKISVRDAILGTLTKSANDAAVVLGEAISGSEKKFAELMNRTAQKLGLTKTVCINASGWPDNAHGFVDPKQVTTAADLAKLSRLLMKDFPQYYKFFSTQKFIFRGTTFRNSNSLLRKKKGVDGLKTGYGGGAVGFNLAASEKRGHQRVIAVVLGARTPQERNQKTSALLDKGFELLEKKSKDPRLKKQNLPQSETSPEDDIFNLEGLEEIFEETQVPSSHVPFSEKALSPEFDENLDSLFDEDDTSSPKETSPQENRGSLPSQPNEEPVPFGKTEGLPSFEIDLSEVLERDEKEVLDAVLASPQTENKRPLKKTETKKAKEEKEAKKSPLKKLPQKIPFGKTRDLPFFDASLVDTQEDEDVKKDSIRSNPTLQKEKNTNSKKWSLQVATLPTASKAKEEGKRLTQAFPAFLKVNRLRVSKTEKKGQKKNFSVRFLGFTKKEALKACHTLRAQKKQCVVIEP
ncbi:MAG TPA: D-alanyl-D-alanine carboxypeptidase [Alphaproteobacteria bacterium]|nr:D-alanyl-D-alanine carboxypeptidase [Alphaproteobacteria bacterium]HQS93798.1 D-alanyl-D-alanine carboxypeptidase [Alphaproteobacteria bacterium]